MNKSLNKFPALSRYVQSLLKIPAGPFKMGGIYWRSESNPVHHVSLSSFRMGATPVTVAVWQEYCSATGTTLPRAPSWGLLDDHPVVNVSWNDIMGADGNGGFCAWASDVAGLHLTLPTEAQFEYAARGGQDGLAYPWGDSFDDSFVWSSIETNRTSTASVFRSSNRFKNAYGLFDMAGNVWQWCYDMFAPYAPYAPYYIEPLSNPSGPISSTSTNVRTVRGGSWSVQSCRDSFNSAFRMGNSPDSRYVSTGFRLCVDDMKTLPNVECRSSWGSQSSKILSSLIPEKRKCRSSIYPALQEYSESLCNIPAGTLDVGGRKNAFDKPSQTVTLSEYRLGATPVTVAIWKEYCASSGTTLPEAPAWGLLDDHPIVNVSWNDIMGTDGKGGFCAWASDVAGFRLTLPTEAQFEYAAQGGQRGLVYPWGNSFDEKKLWCSLLLKTRRTGTAPVIRTSHTYKNDFGLIDMSGNVWQWCSDLFYDASSLANFVGPASEFFVNHHAVHGGSWYYGTQKFFTCNHRNGIASRGKYYDIGFRLSAGPG